MRSFLDTYSIYARFRPAMLVLFPLFVTLATQFPAIYQTGSAAIFSIAAGCGVLYFLASGVRYMGRKKEVELYEIWGGMPSTLWLRHGDANLDPVTKSRYHSFLSGKISVPFPSRDDEAQDSLKADDIYRSATKWLLEFTRDKKAHPMVFSENVSYGFRRNCLGIKPYALAISFFCAAFTGVSIYVHGVRLTEIDDGKIISLAVSTVCLFLWMLLVTPNWVKDAAHAYVRALFASCDTSPV